MSKIRFQNSPSPFFTTLRKKVDAYFKENNLSQTANLGLHLQGIFHVALAVALYISLVFYSPSALIAVPLIILFGANLAFIGFNLMHGAAHGSFSKHKWLNSLGAYTLNMMGGTTYFWKLKHNINHHTYTNIAGMDGDIDPKPFMRFHEHQELKGYHKYQHIYFPFLYSLSYISWVFIDDFTRYFGKEIVHGAKPMTSRKEHIIFWVTKVYFATVFLFLPVYLIGPIAVGGILLALLTCGYILAQVFQLAHVMEETDFPLPTTDTNLIENEWAIHQIETTCNFGTSNPVLNFLLGGLNYQVEHHIFPKMSHVHYKEVSKIVKETCQEFGVNYVDYPTMWSAMGAHRDHMKKLGHQQFVLANRKAMAA